MFPYRCARANPDKLYVGIDTNIRPLEKISEKAFRKPSKGGTPNLLYLLASVEDLPEELNGIASETFVLYPWGGLLKGVLEPDLRILKSLRRICCGTLHIAVTMDPERDRTELRRLGLSDFSTVNLNTYRQAGFEFVDESPLQFETTWSKKLQQNHRRTVRYLTFAALRPFVKSIE